jgi:hypothetical protein
MTRGVDGRALAPAIASCVAIATTAGLPVRLDSARLPPRTTPISPALSVVSPVSSTSVTSPSVTTRNSTVFAFCEYGLDAMLPQVAMEPAPTDA